MMTLKQSILLLALAIAPVCSFGQGQCTKRLLAGNWQCLYRFRDTAKLDTAKILASIKGFYFEERPNSFLLNEWDTYVASGPYFATGNRPGPTSEGSYRLNEKTCVLRLDAGYGKKAKAGRDWHILYVTINRMIARSSGPEGTFIYVFYQRAFSDGPPPGG